MLKGVCRNTSLIWILLPDNFFFQMYLPFSRVSHKNGMKGSIGRMLGKRVDPNFSSFPKKNQKTKPNRNGTERLKGGRK